MRRRIHIRTSIRVNLAFGLAIAVALIKHAENLGQKQRGARPHSNNAGTHKTRTRHNTQRVKAIKNHLSELKKLERLIGSARTMDGQTDDRPYKFAIVTAIILRTQLGSLVRMHAKQAQPKPKSISPTSDVFLGLEGPRVSQGLFFRNSRPQMISELPNHPVLVKGR